MSAKRNEASRVPQRDHQKKVKYPHKKRRTKYHHHPTAEIAAGIIQTLVEDKESTVEDNMIAGLWKAPVVEVTLIMIMVDVDEKPIPIWMQSSRSRKTSGLPLHWESNKTRTWKVGRSI